MVATLFGLTLAAHLLGDFVLQTDRMAAKKREKSGFGAILLHAAIIMLLNLAALYLLVPGWWPLLASAAITLAHIGIDCLRNCFRGERYNTLKFLIDQLLHAAAAAAVVYAVWAQGYRPASGLYYALKPLFSLPEWSAFSDKTVWTVVTALAFVWGGAYLIRFILKDSRLYAGTACDDSRTTRAGKWIGILERMAILVLIPMEQWAAVGLLIAAKSIARHKKMDEEGYAEYFLIGTLLSFLFAVGGGLILLGIWGRP